MKHPYKQFVQLQYISLVVTLILGVFALMKGSPLLALFTCLTLALGFGFESLVEWKKNHTFLFAQQVLRATVLIVFVCFLYFI